MMLVYFDGLFSDILNWVSDVELMLRRDLKRTKALLQDAQLMLQKYKDGAGNRSTLKQLRSQVSIYLILRQCDVFLTTFKSCNFNTCEKIVKFIF